MLRNTEHSYGWLHRLLHWLIALMILGMLGVGIYMAGLNEDIPAEEARHHLLAGLHKATGMIVLVLVLVRLFWAITNITPALPDTLPAWQRKAAKGMHHLLYLLMICVPASGYIMVSYVEKPVDIYGLFSIPPLFSKNIDKAMEFHEIHEIFAFVLLGLIILHFIIALKHHFIDKDNVLKRMLSGD